MACSAGRGGDSALVRPRVVISQPSVSVIGDGGTASSERGLNTNVRLAALEFLERRMMEGDSVTSSHITSGLALLIFHISRVEFPLWLTLP